MDAHRGPGRFSGPFDATEAKSRCVAPSFFAKKTGIFSMTDGVVEGIFLNGKTNLGSCHGMKKNEMCAFSCPEGTVQYEKFRETNRVRDRFAFPAALIDFYLEIKK